MQRLKRALFSFITVISVFGISTVFTIPVYASALTIRPGFIGGPNFVVDGFKQLTYSPNEAAGYDYWWVTLNSSIPPLRGENIPCHGVANPTSNCARIETEHYGPFNLLTREFARLSIEPDAFSPFWISQLSDVREATGNRVERWMPTEWKPVVMTGRLRFSPNYKLDGSGNANGSSGFGLWNSPAQLLDAPPFLTFRVLPESLFFTYSEVEALNGDLAGYTANYFDMASSGSLVRPIQTQHVSGINMNDWFDVKIVWTVKHSGVQHAAFYVEGHKIKEFDLVRPIGPLSAVMWVDSSRAVETGGVAGVEVSAPVEKQYMDIDNVTITNF